MPLRESSSPPMRVRGLRAGRGLNDRAAGKKRGDPRTAINTR
jgi:hypothetical protein